MIETARLDVQSELNTTAPGVHMAECSPIIVARAGAMMSNKYALESKVDWHTDRILMLKEACKLRNLASEGDARELQR